MLISWYYDNLLARYCSFKKRSKLISQKYFQSSVKKKIKTYIKGCNDYLLSKKVKFKLYNKL